MKAKERKTRGWLEKAIRLNNERLLVRFEEARRESSRWLLECRDLWDSEDDDAGVYFVACKDAKEVDGFVAEMTKKDSTDRILGIYNLRKDAVSQGPGLSSDEWSARRRRAASLKS